MKDNDFVTEYVNTLITIPDKSEYQGEVGEWLVKDVLIEKNIALESRFGLSHMHIMRDSDENVYVWTTGSKDYEAGTMLHLKMKVKDHKEYNGTKQTIVWYCKQA